jgi:hypothetical protein
MAFDALLPSAFTAAPLIKKAAPNQQQKPKRMVLSFLLALFSFPHHSPLRVFLL